MKCDSWNVKCESTCALKSDLWNVLHFLLYSLTTQILSTHLHCCTKHDILLNSWPLPFYQIATATWCCDRVLTNAIHGLLMRWSKFSPLGREKVMYWYLLWSQKDSSSRRQQMRSSQWETVSLVVDRNPLGWRAKLQVEPIKATIPCYKENALADWLSLVLDRQM